MTTKCIKIPGGRCIDVRGRGPQCGKPPPLLLRKRGSVVHVIVYTAARPSPPPNNERETDTPIHIKHGIAQPTPTKKNGGGGKWRVECVVCWGKPKKGARPRDSSALDNNNFFYGVHAICAGRSLASFLALCASSDWAVAWGTRACCCCCCLFIIFRNIRLTPASGAC